MRAFGHKLQRHEVLRHGVPVYRPEPGVSRLSQFLSSVPVLASLRPEQIESLAAGVVEREYRAGDLILRAGDSNHSLYLLERGRLAVQVRRGESTETVAHLHSGAPFGELSLVTGRPCAADVRVVVDAVVAVIPGAVLNQLGEERRLILERLATTVAERLHSSIATAAEEPQAHVILLHPYPHWRAPSAFAVALVRSLVRQTGWRTLRVDLGHLNGIAPAQTSGDPDAVSVIQMDATAGLEALRAELSLHLQSWRQQFACIVLNPGPEIAARRRKKWRSPTATW